VLTAGLVSVAVAHLDGRNKDYEAKLIGALKFLDGTIETSRQFAADVYVPSIQLQSKPRQWILSGLMVIRDSVPGRPRYSEGVKPFSAIMESICPVYSDPACWRLETLAVDNRVINTLELVRSDPTIALKNGTKGSGIKVSPPEAPSMPDRAKTAVTLTMTTSSPVANVNSAGQESLQCVEQAAWRDPDIARNRQLIIDEAICLKVIEFIENNLKWRVQVLDSGRSGSNWIVLHDDEDTAFDSALYAIVSYGGKVIDVDFQLSRMLHAAVDPNHNFGITYDQRRTCEGSAGQAAPVFTKTIIDELGDPPYLALHNNYDGHFHLGGRGNISVRYNSDGLFGLPANNAVERLADEDNFIIVSGLMPPNRMTDQLRQVTDELRSLGVNVIYEYVQEDANDCSLSNYLLLYGGAQPGQYFNVEAEAGDYRSQIAMIDALVGILFSPSLASKMGDGVLTADKIKEPVRLRN